MWALDLDKLNKWLDANPIQVREQERKRNDLFYKRLQVAGLRRRLEQAEIELAMLELHESTT